MSFTLIVLISIILHPILYKVICKSTSYYKIINKKLQPSYLNNQTIPIYMCRCSDLYATLEYAGYVSTKNSSITTLDPICIAFKGYTKPFSCNTKQIVYSVKIENKRTKILHMFGYIFTIILRI